jgi:hypothetical protein
MPNAWDPAIVHRAEKIRRRQRLAFRLVRNRSSLHGAPTSAEEREARVRAEEPLRAEARP